jgi:hypothetical protein
MNEFILFKCFSRKRRAETKSVFLFILGSHAAVWKAKHKETGQKYRVRWRGDHGKTTEEIEKE